MEVTFQKSPLKYLRRAVREVQNQEQTQEVRLSDGMPDIGRVLCGWGQVILREKQWENSSMEISGGVQSWVLYAPEDGTDARCVESWLPFRVRWDLGQETREGKIRVKPVLRFLDARSLSARKLMVRAGLAVMGEAFVEETVDAALPDQIPEDVQLLKSTYPVMLDKAAGEKPFLLDEDLTLPPSAPVPEKLIYFCVQPELTEVRVSGNRLIFRGNGNLHMLYRAEEGQLHSWDFPLPFSQLAELDQVWEEGAEGDVSLAVTSLELQLEEGHLRLKCGLLGQYLLHDRELLELVEDAYSPVRDVQPEQGTLELWTQLDARQETLTAEQTLTQDADILADIRFLPDFPRHRSREKGASLEMTGQFQVLFYTPDGRLEGTTARWEGDLPFPAGGDTEVLAEPVFRGYPQGVPGNGTVTLRSDTGLQLHTLARETIPMVTGMTAAPEIRRDPDRPSLILRRTDGERLWDIAKQTGSTVDAIRSANDIEGEPGKNRFLLIPIP